MTQISIKIDGVTNVWFVQYQDLGVIGLKNFYQLFNSTCLK